MRDQAKPKTSLSQSLVADLLQWIQQGVVRPGTKLPSETELMNQYGVSRTVVREAITQLKANGIVRTFQGKGSFVLSVPSKGKSQFELSAPNGIEEALALLELRSSIEVAAAGLAATRRTEAQLKALNLALEHIASSELSPASAVEADYEFHIAIAWASNNHYFSQILDSLGPAMLAIPKSRLSHNPTGFDRVYQEHANIFQAIEDADAIAVRAAMIIHLNNSAKRLSSERNG